MTDLLAHGDEHATPPTAAEESPPAQPSPPAAQNGTAYGPLAPDTRGAWMAAVLADAELSFAHKCAAIGLSLCREATAPAAQIATATGQTTRSVEKAIVELETAGWIARATEGRHRYLFRHVPTDANSGSVLAAPANGGSQNAEAVAATVAAVHAALGTIEQPDPDRFDWSGEEDADSIVLDGQQATALYWNKRGDIVIRQEAPYPDEDSFICIRPAHVGALVTRLQRMAREQ